MTRIENTSPSTTAAAHRTGQLAIVDSQYLAVAPKQQPQTRLATMKMRPYFLFFIISGYCSLVYEIIWLRLTVADFGVTTPIVSIVLSVFMAGLGVGSWGAGVVSRRCEKLRASSFLRFYALAELLIGAGGLMVAYELNCGRALLRLSGIAWQSSAYYLVSGIWIAVTLLPWSAFMGATFPFAMAAMRKSFGPEADRSFSYLYLANVLGAVSGTIISTFFLIELFGFRGTLHITSLLNGLLAAFVFLLSIPSSAVIARIEPPLENKRASRLLYDLPQKWVMLLLVATGTTSMGMEVVWIRQFTPYLGNVVYAFAIILALYLVATFVGSRIYRRWIRSHHPTESRFYWMVLGAVGLLPLFLADPKLPIPMLEHQAGFLLGALRVALGIMPFSGLVGFLTPMLVDHWSNGDPDRAGTAYAINVVGCIIGPLLAGFGVLPWLDDRWALFVLAVPLFVIGSVILLRHRIQTAKGHARLQLGRAYVGVVLSSILLTAMTGDYEGKFPGRVVKRDYTASVLASGTGLQKRLLVNGMGMTILTPISKSMAHLPLAYMKRPPKNGLVICFGMGTTFRSMLSWGIQTTAVELVPSVPKLFSYYHSDAPKIVSSPLAKIVIDDGRRFLEGSSEEYDVITLDPPPPVGAPTSSLLYSTEFFTVAKRHLSPGGILQVWLPGGDAATHASVAKALKRTFPYIRAFESIEGWGFHFLASSEPLDAISASVLASRLPAAAASDFVEWGPAHTAEEQFSDLLGRERPLDSFIAEDPRVPALEDDQPINEFFFLRWDLNYYR